MDSSDRWVTLAFTWNGLRALGVAEESLATFPDEFREGMAARADILGDTGANHPDHWVGGLAGTDLHAIAILFARTTSRARALASRSTTSCSARTDGVRSLSYLDLERDAAVQLRPRPFRLPRPAVAAGDRRAPARSRPRLGRGAGAGRVHPRLSRRGRARRRSSRSRRCCRATAATWPTGGCRSTSARSATICASNADTPEEQELLAAKFMGRWRSGAPLVLAPGQGRSRTGRRSACATTTSTTRRWTRSATRARWDRTPAG